MLLMIDNYDSFTYNLVQYLQELEVEVHVVRNDKIDLDTMIALKPRQIVISPGPCTPNESGISMAAIKHFADQIPILGVCLGHQCLAQAYGATISHAKKIMHGKTSLMHHRQAGILAGLTQPFTATRYHSLVILQETLPACFKVTAWTETPEQAIDEIMAIEHVELPLFGVQFHPESVLTEHGHDLLKNFLKY